jgi:hypothetical protein
LEELFPIDENDGTNARKGKREAKRIKPSSAWNK